MSSTIHSFGPKPAKGFSCELVAWVDTAVDRLFQTELLWWSDPRQGYALPNARSSPTPAEVTM
ncbi:hypothetical protein GCM10027610_132460 [Dactylosporangium cerinum]|uniref:Uncharacterized protein n=1 Tax=Dactylosporangium siamense TaxID=685454 RepID=A0A919U8W1_9ACTN|nr:hypothetical protein Dsi01nite_041930 [Dactylosporangium siamense]